MGLNKEELIRIINEHLQNILREAEDREKRKLSKREKSELQDRAGRSLLNVIDVPEDFVQNEFLVATLNKVFHETEYVVQDVNNFRIAMRMEKGEAVDEAQLDEFFEVMKEKGLFDGKDRKLDFAKIAEKYTKDIVNYGDYKEFKDTVKEEVERLSKAANK